jgi:Na+/melibiose symporter-like transporter
MIKTLIQRKEETFHVHKQSFFKDMHILIKSREHLRSLIAVCALWIYAAFNYYLIGYYVKYFPGDVFTNFLMMTAAEVLAPIYLWLVQGRYPSRDVAKFLVIGAALSSIAYILN